MIERVGKEVCGNGLRVSTVKLSCNRGSDLRPLWYETMVFRGETYEEVEGYTRRYATREQAEQGHKEVCDLVMGP